MGKENDKIPDVLASKTDYFDKSEKNKPPIIQGNLVDPQSKQDKTKAWLAKALVIIFGSTISASFIFILIGIVFSNNINIEDLKDLLTLILTSEVGILGTVLGFYFGNQSKY